MAELYQYMTNSGLIVPDTGEILTEVQNEFKAVFGEGLSLDPATPQGRLIEMIAKERIQIVGLNALIANQINIDYATGNYLDSLGSLFGINRFGATRTRVFCTITGRSGTIISHGSVVQNDEKENFTLENSVTIGISGTVNGYFLAQNIGHIACPINTLKKIITNVIGWETVNNPTLPDIGENQEGDFDLSTRIKASRYSGIGMIGDIEAFLFNTEGVKSFVIINNPTDTVMTIEGINILKHSILAVIDGGSNANVGNSLYKTVSSGCDYTPITNQSVVIQIPSGYGFDYPITFNRPLIQEVIVNVTMRKDSFAGTTQELIDITKDTIANWALNGYMRFTNLKVGKEVSGFEIASVVNSAIPSATVKSMLIAFFGSTPSFQELQIKINQIAHIAINNITVTVE